MSRVLSRASSVDEALDALLPALAEALGWDCAAVWVVGSDRRHLECARCWSLPDPKFAEFLRVTRDLHLGSGEGLPGRVWASGTSVGLRDVVHDSNFRRAAIAEACGLHGGLAFPVWSAAKVVAVVEFFTRRAERADEGLLRLTEALGHQIGQFLQRRNAETLLEENEQRYAAIVNGALDAIVAIDHDGFITEFNPAAERLFGYTRADVLGKEMAEIIIPPSYREAHRTGVRSQRESRESHVLERRLELQARRRNGEDFPIELTISRIPGRGRSAFIGCLRDITERKRQEQEREAILASERVARDEAVTASRLKDEFLAALSHELRTPLNAVLGWTQILESEALPGERRREVLATIRRNAEAQKQVVDDMLDVSAFIAGRVRIAMEEFPLAEPIQAAATAIQPGADAKHLTIRVTVPDVRVRADRNRLRQVFWNLLANAVKFTPEGGTIDVTATVGENAVEVGVRDTGRGIDPAFLPFVFDRFRQAPSARVQGGLGLGLAIVRQIVEAHGGTISGHSDGEGQGSEFVVQLPTLVQP